MSLIQIQKLKENILKTKNYSSLIVAKKESRYLLIDGHHRLQILKELGHKEVWCEVWELPRKNADLALATLNRLHGVDDDIKRAKLIGELVKDFGGEIEMLVRLLPEDEKTIETYLKVSELGLDEISEDLKTELIENKLMQIVDEDGAKRMARAYNPRIDELRIAFVFDKDEDYIKAHNYFGINPDTQKLMKLIGHD